MKQINLFRKLIIMVGVLLACTFCTPTNPIPNFSGDCSKTCDQLCDEATKSCATLQGGKFRKIGNCTPVTCPMACNGSCDPVSGPKVFDDTCGDF